MIPSEFLVANSERTDEKDITKLQDKDLIILLGGLKYLAQLRGYESVTYSINGDSTQISAICRIIWVPNYETSMKQVVFESVAEANLYNTRSFAKNFLASIAENRAFCRAVRNFLKIHIVSDAELGDDKSSAESDSSNRKPEEKPHEILSKLITEKGTSFEKLKEKLVEEKIENAEKFNKN